MSGDRLPRSATNSVGRRRVPSLARWWGWQITYLTAGVYTITSEVVPRFQLMGAIGTLFLFGALAVLVYRIRCGRCGWPILRRVGTTRLWFLFPAVRVKRACVHCGADLWEY